MFFEGFMGLQSFEWVLFQAVMHKVNKIIWIISVLRKTWRLLVQYLQKNFHGRLIVEWRVALGQFDCGNTQRPHVNPLVIAHRLVDNLRCHPARRTDEFVFLLSLFDGIWYSKITEHDLTVAMYQHIWAFDVSMDNAQWVQIYQTF